MTMWRDHGEFDVTYDKSHRVAYISGIIRRGFAYTVSVTLAQDFAPSSKKSGKAWRSPYGPSATKEERK